MLKCHFIAMASDELTSGCKVIISSEERQIKLLSPLTNKLGKSFEIFNSYLNKFPSECDILKAEMNILRFNQETSTYVTEKFIN
jgi:hypothetical protein